MEGRGFTKYVVAVVLLLAAFVSVAVVVVRHRLINPFPPEGLAASDDEAGGHEGQGNGFGTSQARGTDRDPASKSDRGGAPPARREPGGGGLAKSCLVSAQLIGLEPAKSVSGGKPKKAVTGRRQSEAAAGANRENGVTLEMAAHVPDGQATESAEDGTGVEGGELSAVAAAVDTFYALLNRPDTTHEQWRQTHDQLVAAIDQDPENPEVPDALYALSLFFRESDVDEVEVKRCLLEQLLAHPRAYDSLKVMALEDLYSVYIRLHQPVRAMSALSERGQLILGLSDEPLREGESSLRDWWLDEYYEDFWDKAHVASWLLEQGLLESPELPARERGKMPSDHLQELLNLMPQIRAAQPAGVPREYCDYLESQTLGLLGYYLKEEAAIRTTGFSTAELHRRSIPLESLPRDERRAAVYRRLRVEFPHWHPVYSAALLEAEALDPARGEEFVRVLEKAERDAPPDDVVSRRMLTQLITSFVTVGLQRGRSVIERLEPLVLAGNPDLKAEVELATRAPDKWPWPARPSLSPKHCAELEADRLLRLGDAYACPDVADYARAVDYYRQALASPVKDALGAEIYWGLIRAYQHLKDYQAAVFYADELVARYPGELGKRGMAEYFERLRAAAQQIAVQSNTKEEER